MKQTAVEWLVDYLTNIKELPFIRQDLNINEQNILKDIIDQAKQMEKEKELKQWSDTWTSGYFSGWDNCMKKYNFKSEE